MPRHNCSSSSGLPRELPAELLSARLVWIRRGIAAPPLHPLYDGPFTVIHRGTRSFTLQVGTREEIVAVSRLKACTAADAVPGSPRRRPLGKRPGGSAAPKRVTFHIRWSLCLKRRRCETVLVPFSYPSRRFLYARDRRHHQRLHNSGIRRAIGHRHGIRNASGHRLRGWTSDLFSSQPRPELGGSSVENRSACTVHQSVHLYISPM